MEIIVLLGAIVVTGLVFTWLVNVVKTTISTALLVAAIVLGLYFLFGVGPGQIAQLVSQFFRSIWQLVTGGR